MTLARARPYVYLTPTLLALGAFTYFPIARLAAMSLEAPAATYGALVHNPLFWRVVGQTCLYVGISVPLTIGFALGLALLLDRKIRGVGVFRVLYYTPVVMPTVAVAALALWLFNANGGVVDYLLGRIGLPHIPWLESTSWALVTLILVAVWKNLGYYAIIYLAALQGLPLPVLDAARLDGARPLVRFFTVTFPLLRPTTFFLSVVGVIASFQVFDFVNLMTQGGPSNATNVLVYFAYQNGFSYMQLGAAAAVSLAMFALVLAILGLLSWVLNR
jgi:ABC-type sugar transport system permease subunit